MNHAVVWGVSTPKSFRVFRAALPLAALLVTLFLTPGQAQTASRWATLEAIHNLENPQNLPRPGARGELGAYQFRASTWHLHTNTPFSAAIDRQASDEVAMQHYEYLRKGLEAAGIPVTPYTIALAWNSGLGAATSGRAPAAAHDYAQRATNLATSFDRRGIRIVISQR